jgi:hypothetical protein
MKVKRANWLMSIIDEIVGVLTCLVFSFNIFYLPKSCKWDWTQVMTTLVKSFPFYKDINKK